MKSCASQEDLDVGVGERLREERTRLGLNQDAFAQQGGITRNTQGSYEKSERNPDSAYLTAVARAGVDVLYVLTGVRLSPTANELDAAENQLIQQLRTLSEYDQKAVHRIVGAMAEVTHLSAAKK